jgi:hypothetical protein
MHGAPTDPNGHEIRSNIQLIIEQELPAVFLSSAGKCDITPGFAGMG